MEECATCIICKNQTWFIYQDKMQCSKCKKEYRWDVNCEPLVATKASDLVNLANDNY